MNGREGGKDSVGLTQFQNQFDAVESPTPRERIGRGKISPTTTHAEGPQVIAKQDMFKQIKAIIAATAELLCLDVLPDVRLKSALLLLHALKTMVMKQAGASRRGFIPAVTPTIPTIN